MSTLIEKCVSQIRPALSQGLVTVDFDTQPKLGIGNDSCPLLSHRLAASLLKPASLNAVARGS